MTGAGMRRSLMETLQGVCLEGPVALLEDESDATKRALLSAMRAMPGSRLVL